MGGWVVGVGAGGFEMVGWGLDAGGGRGRLGFIIRRPGAPAALHPLLSFLQKDREAGMGVPESHPYVRGEGELRTMHVLRICTMPNPRPCRSLSFAW